MRIFGRIGPVPRIIFVGVVAVAVVILGAAFVKSGVHKGGGMDRTAFGYLDVGNFWLKVWNINWAGDQAGDHAGEWPGGSGIGYLYSHNIWFGTLMANGIHVSGDFPYSGSNEWQEQPPSDQDLLMSNKSNWAGRPDYIEKVGDLDTYAFTNDNEATELGPIPLDFEMHGMQWSAPGHNDWIVFECWMNNRYSSPLTEAYVSLATDLDIGGSLDYIDDLVGYEGNDTYDNCTNPTIAGVPWNPSSPADGIPDENDVVNFNTWNGYPLGRGRMMAYMYDSGGESRNTPGYCGIRVMGWMDDDDPEGSIIEISSQHSWDIMNDPSTDAYKYGYMIDTGTYEEVNTPYDWRIDPVFGPFELGPSKKVHWWTGIVMGGDLYEMRKNADQLYRDFVGQDGIPGTEDDWQVVSPPMSPRLIAVRGDNQITLRWNPNYAVGGNTETDPDPRSGVVDFDGYIVWRSNIGFDSGWEPILWVDKLSNNANVFHPWGWRIKNAGNRTERIPDGPGGTGTDYNEPDLTKTPAVTYENLKTSFPTPAREGSAVRVRKVSGYYELVDGVDSGGEPSGVLSNGTRYYYAVVAYDFGAITPFEATPTAGGRNINALQVIPLPNSRNALDQVKVVPNPYKGSANWEEWTGSGARLGKIYFMNLPAKCTIRIYTVAGDLVRTLEHNDVAYGAEPWDLTGNAGVQVASGIYVYHIDAPGIGEKIGKFAVLIGQN